MGHLLPAVPSTVGSSTVPVVLTWQVSGAGACEYYVRINQNGVLDDSIVSGKSLTTTASVGSTYQVSVWPLDCSGNFGTPASTNPFHVDRYTEADIGRSGPNWSFKNVANAVGGRIAVNKTPGSSFSFFSCYTNLAWIAQKGPQGGRASVSVDGVPLTSVDLFSATVKDRQLVAKTFDSGSGCHLVTVTNTSTSPTRNQLTVDALYQHAE